MARPHLGLVAACAALACLALASFVPDMLIFNRSSSMPRGFYVRISAAPSLGSVVTVRSRDVSPTYARERGFDDARDRFIKRIVAAEGDTVCAEGGQIWLDGDIIAERTFNDSAGRALPRWTGCHVLRADEFFLLGETADSFDSRYFGWVRASQLESVWRPLA